MGRLNFYDTCRRREVTHFSHLAASRGERNSSASLGLLPLSLRVNESDFQLKR
jgi:hypothetical protein